MIVNANGWRIEAEVIDAKCPQAPDHTVYRMLELERGRRGKTSHDVAAADCDWLNEQVRLGRIVRQDGCMVAHEYATKIGK